VDSIKLSASLTIRHTLAQLLIKQQELGVAEDLG